MPLFKKKVKKIKVYDSTKCHTCLDWGTITSTEGETITFISDRSGQERTANRFYTRPWGELHHTKLFKG